MLSCLGRVRTGTGIAILRLGMLDGRQKTPFLDGLDVEWRFLMKEVKDIFRYQT